MPSRSCLCSNVGRVFVSKPQTQSPNTKPFLFLPPNHLFFCISYSEPILLSGWVISSIGTPHWELINDLPTICNMYLRGTFVLDFIGQIPWQYLDCVFEDLDASWKALRLLRLMKLFRLHRISRMIQVHIHLHTVCKHSVMPSVRDKSFACALLNKPGSF